MVSLDQCLRHANLPYLIEEIETSLSVGIQLIGGRLLRKLTKRLGSALAFLHILP